MSLLLIHAASTLAMTGVIWFVQLVHYPLLSYASAGDFSAFSTENQKRTTWVVAPLMIAEMISATALLAVDGEAGTRHWALAGWLLLAAIWASTFFVQVPLHGRLTRGFTPDAARKLVRSNWVRTVGWSLRAALALLLLR